MSTTEASIPQPEPTPVTQLVHVERVPIAPAAEQPSASTSTVTTTGETTTPTTTTEAVPINPVPPIVADPLPPIVSPSSPPKPPAPPTEPLETAIPTVTAPPDPPKKPVEAPESSQPAPANLTISKPNTSHRRSSLTSGKGDGKRKRAITPVSSTSDETAENNGVEEKDFQIRLPAGSAEAEAPTTAEAEFTEDFSRPTQPTEAMLTSDELNFLVYRYLLESGFVHSAFVFGGESYISKTNIEDTAQMVPGALISFVQKGLQYLEIESHINDDGTETVCDEAFSVMKPHVCSANTTKKRIFEPYEPMSADYGFLELDDDEVLFLKAHEDLITTCVWSPNGHFLASGSADGSTRVWDIQHQAIPGKCTTSLALLKSGSKVEGEETDKKTKSEEPSRKRPRARKSNVSTQSSVLAVAWKDDNVLATGSYDGTTQIWTATGQLLHSSVNHQGPICCIQWSKKGSLNLATGGMDNAVTIQKEDGTVLARYTHHTGPILDLDWKNSTIFATASTDHKVCVFELGKPEPTRELVSHRGDVNAVRWDADGHFLASCGADCAVKVWNVLTGACVHDFREHTREVVCIAWAPSLSSSSPSSLSSSLGSPKTSSASTPSTSFSTNSSSSSFSSASTQPSLLASGSMDTTIKIWDLVHGKCCLTIAKHAHPVTALVFSPQGDSIVSGAHERLCMWNVKNGDLLRTFKHEGGINHLSWNNDGKLAAGYSDNLVCVMDLRGSKAE